jgi:hypothetical protein
LPGTTGFAFATTASSSTESAMTAQRSVLSVAAKIVSD